MSLNKVILIGNVGRDPDIRYFEGGNAIANFTVATNERGYRLANGTEVPERTDWHNIVVRGDRVQFIERHVRKGSSVLVDGKLRYREYEKEGVRRFVTEIVADRVDFYGANPRRENNGEYQQGGYSQYQQPQQQQYQQPYQPQQNSSYQPQVVPAQQPVVPAAQGEPLKAENAENPADDLPF